MNCTLNRAEDFSIHLCRLVYSERSACLGSELQTVYCLCFQDSQDFAGRIERMLRLSMGVDLEAMVEPEEEEAEEKEEEDKDGEEIDAEGDKEEKTEEESASSEEGATEGETKTDEKEDEVEVSSRYK